MKHKICQALAALFVFLAYVSPSMAEDIELFVGVPTTTQETPNIMIVLDNTANWNSAFVNEKAALVSVFNGMPHNKFRIGLMMFTETGGGNSGEDGAYVRLAARMMTSDDPVAGTIGTKTKYAAVINSLDITGDKSNGGKVGKAMMEAYRYLTGGTVHAGNNKSKTDYTGNTAGNAYDDAVHALSGNALSSKTATTYSAPTSADCVKNYIIYISNGPAQDNTSDIGVANTALRSAGGSTTTISINPSGSQDNPADEWSRFMKRPIAPSTFRGVVYTLDVDKSATGQGPGWSALMKSMASQSGGRYFDVASTGTGIQDAINSILSEIQSVNSVFASVSLPVAVNQQGSYLNQVYIGMFRPDGTGSPKWQGNLKQYKMAFLNSELKLVDANGAATINNQTGFITECSRSYWTPSTVDTEWNAAQESDCLTISGAGSSNYPDGNVVAKGGQAYKLRASTSRTALTCADASCTSVVTFNSTNVSQPQLDASSSTDQTNLINWSKGMDNNIVSYTSGVPNYEDENLNGLYTDNRLSAHGDVIHSKPVAVNFGTTLAPKVMVFYGANDGWLRAVNGNRADAIGTVTAGSEAWAFAPPEFISKFKRLRAKSPVVYYLNTPVGTATRKDYGIDGPITAYQGTLGGSTKTAIYATMRRGGRSIYAFDVTNAATSPASPTYKWRLGCTAAGDCSPGMDGIGQTWGAVKTFTHGNYGSGTSPLLMFGGGYDTCEDYDALSSGGANHNCTSSSTGHYVYIVDADTGAVVKTFDTSAEMVTAINKYRGVIADMAVVTGTDGHAKYAYVADLGGNVFRITLTGASSAWTMTQIASLGCDTASTACTANRKFMFAPSVVNSDAGEYTLLLGSGDREKPITGYTAATAVSNYFFMFKDKPGNASYPGTTDCGVAVSCLASLYRIEVDAAAPASLGTKKGWYQVLHATEQVVVQAITIFSVTTFSTHQPAVTGDTPTPGTCSNLGETLLYARNFETGRWSGEDPYEDVAGDGLPPSPTAGLVTLDSGETVPFCIGCSADSPLESKKPTASTSSIMPKGRLYWYLDKK